MVYLKKSIGHDDIDIRVREGVFFVLFFSIFWEPTLRGQCAYSEAYNPVQEVGIRQIGAHWKVGNSGKYKACASSVEGRVASPGVGPGFHHTIQILIRISLVKIPAKEQVIKYTKWEVKPMSNCDRR